MHHAIKHIARLRLLREFCARFAFSCALAALLAAPAARAELPVPPAAFDKGSTITVAGYAGTTPLADFPVLVRLAEGSPAGFSYAQLHSPADGADLLFTDADGAPIPFEIDTWDADGTSLVWVTPPVTTNGAQFAMFWGSDAAGAARCADSPWSAYTGVWHMGDPGDGVTNVLDSTANHLDGTTVTSSKAVSDGKIGGARFITSNTSNTAGQPYDSGVTVDLADADKLAAVDAIVPEFTASFWVRPKGDPQYWYFITRKTADKGKGWGFQQGASGDFTKYRAYGGSENDDQCTKISDVAGMANATWTKVDAVWMADKTFKLYFDGSLKKTATLVNAAQNGPESKLALGGALAPTANDQKSGRGVYGDMDEIRLRPGAASPDWIAADYATQTSASFLSLSPAEDAAPPAEPLFSSVAFASAAETTATFSVGVKRIGEGSASATLSAVVREAGAAAATTNAVATVTGAGTETATLTGLAPATAYEVFFRLENEVDGVAYATESETLSFETAAIDENPTVSLSLSRVYAAAADLEVSVPRFGYGASSLSSLSLSYGTDPADESGWTTVALAPPAAEGGTVAHRLVGLRTGATYYAKVVAANDLAAPGSFTTPVLSFTPAGSGSVGGGADESVPQLADYRVASGENTVAVSARVAGLGFGGASASLRFRVAETREGLDAAAWTDGAADLAVGDAVAFGAGELDGFATAWVETEIRNDLGAAWTYRGVADVTAPTFEPAVSLVLTDLSATSAVISVAVESFGYRATRLGSLVLAWGTDEADESGWTAIPLAAPAAEGGSVAVPLAGLAEGTTYYAKATAVNDLAEPRSADATLSFTPFEPTTFLQKLATHASHVASSPYATGGDVILKLGEAEYVHVFTNTASAATFTPAQALTARVLVVGGGGPGDWGQKGWTGGGGAGGMVERSGIALEAGTDYAVTVGAGGDMRMSSTRVSGGNSFFDSITAYGGGYGGGNGWGATKGGNGGSGGGAQYNEGVSGGSGTAGQGNAGGSIVVTSGKNMCGGGGGAGAPGTDITSANILGHGGDGLENDILGFAQYFAGGGAGGGTFHALVRGGKGGGGTPNANGEDGLGGGGGAAYGAQGTKGGDGIVVVRYVDPTFAAPSVADVAVSLASPRTANVSGRLACVGAGASSATVTIDVWPTSDLFDVSTTVLAANLSEGGSFSGVLAGLSRDTAYSWSLHAENDDSVPSTAVTGSFTTWSDSLAASSTGAETSTIGHDTVLVFTNATTGGTFTPTGSGIARILVVGGGGSGGGWCGGGGGAGGLVYDAAAYFEAGKTYDVTVGAGGVFGTSAAWKQGASGGDSSIIADSGATVVAQAKGGGGGGNRGTTEYSADGMAGGSGGGGGNNDSGIPGFGTSGQGNDGGIALAPTYFGGGGGGAGGPGGSGTDAKAGDGGAGVAYSITGESVVYAAGGGGGTCYTSASVACDESTAGKGGSGIGGDGEYYRTPYVKAGSGTANTGSGGGGGSGRGIPSNQPGIGGDGADGIVVIRYTDYAAAEQDNTPQLDDLVVTAFDATSATFPVSLVLAGGTASTATITAHWALEGGTTTNSQVLASSFSGTATFTVAGLFPGQPYVLSVEADNGLPDGRATVSCAFSTAPMFSGPLALAATGGTLSYVVDGASDGAQRLELWVGPDAASLTNQATYTDASLLAAGSHAIQPFAAEQFGTNAAILLRHISVVDGIAFTNDTAVLSATLLDAVDYTWRSDVADGDWCDAANWTSSGGMRGWPTVGSTAKFPNAVVTCRVDRAVAASTITYTASGSTTFLGTDEDAAIALSAQMDLPQNGTVVFDGISLTSTAAIKFYNGTTLKFLNGSAATVSGFNGDQLTSPNTTFEVRSSTVSGSFTERELDIILEDATVFSTGLFSFSNGTGRNGARIRFLDGASRIVTTNTLYSTGTPADPLRKPAVILDLAADGEYSTTDALIRMNKKDGRALCNDGGVIVFSCPTTEGSKKLAGCEILVADWSVKTGSPIINTALVEFGEVDRDGSYFYFTEAADSTGTRYKSAAEVTAASATAKYLWYHHEGAKQGLFLIVR